MMKAGGLDAVDIAAPRAVHAELVRLAASFGLPTLCQKPLAPTLAEAEALVADVSGRIRLMVHENWRFRTYYRDAAAWLREGRIGTVIAARLSLVTSGTVRDADGKYPALERQPFMRSETRMLAAEVLIHHLDTLRMLLGPLEVKASSVTRTNPEIVGEDTAVIQLATASGAPVSVFASFAAHGAPSIQSDKLEILGDRGAIRLDGPILESVGAWPERREYNLSDTYIGSYAASLEHFITSLADETEFETSPQDNLKTLKLVEDCYRVAGWRG
jgi:D-apiose dehydrogenase